MPDVAALELQIGADVSGVIAGLDKYEKSIDDIRSGLAAAKAVQESTYDPKLIVSYGRKIQDLTRLENERLRLIKKANSVIVPGVHDQEDAMNKMAKSSSAATNSLFALSGVVQDAPYGFRAIANNITFFTQQMAYSVKSAGGLGAAIKSMGSAFLGPAGLIFAVSGTVSILDSLTQKYGSLGAAIDAITSTVNLAEQQQKRIEKAYSDSASAIEGAMEKIGKVQAILNSASEGYLSSKTALSQYNKELGDTFGKVTSLQQAQSKLTDSAADYIQAVTYQAVATQLLGQASKEVATNIAEQAKTNADAATTMDKIGNFLTLLVKGGNATGGNIFQAFANSMKEMNAQSGQAEKNLSQLTTQNDVGHLMASMQEYYDKAAKIFPHVFDTGQIKSFGKTSQSVLKELADSLKAIDVKKNLLGESYLDAATDKIKLYTKAIEDLAKAGVKPTADAIQDIISKIDALRGVLVRPLSTDLLQKQFTKVASGGNATDVFGSSGTPQTINPNINAFKKLNLNNNQIKEAQDLIKKGLEKNLVLAQSLDEAFESVVSSLFNGGNAVQALTQVIEALIVKLTAAAAVAAVLAVLTGGGSMAAGGATAGFGTNFLKFFGKLTGLPFASGGIVSGPTQALIGEYAGARSNPEVVAPLSKLKAMLGSADFGNNRIEITGRLVGHGQDLLTVIEGTKRRNSRRN